MPLDIENCTMKELLTHLDSEFTNQDTIDAAYRDAYKLSPHICYLFHSICRMLNSFLEKEEERKKIEDAIKNAISKAMIDGKEVH